MTYGTDVVELLPWVKRLKHGRRCDAYRGMSRRARNDPELRERYRCQSPALWHFAALTGSQHYFVATSGYYCWNHLMSQGYRSAMHEEDRAHRWWIRHLDEVNELRLLYGKPTLRSEELT